MKSKEYRINTFIDQVLYDEWKVHMHKQGMHVFGRESQLSMSTRRCLEWGIRKAMSNPKIMKEIMADDNK